MEKTTLVEDLIVIGGSAGSLEIILQLVPSLPVNFNAAVVLVLHRKASNDAVLSHLLKSKSSIPVRDIEEKDAVRGGCIYICPGDYHLLFESDGTFSLDVSERIWYSRPSIDVAFESAAIVYGSKLTCVLLSGANTDGAEGMLFARSRGAYTIAQSPESADLSTMPAAAIAMEAAMITMQPPEILSYLISRRT